MKKSNQMVSEGPLNSDILRAGFHGFSIFSNPLSLLFQFLDLLGLDLTPEANHGEVPDQPQGGSGVQSAPRFCDDDSTAKGFLEVFASHCQSNGKTI